MNDRNWFSIEILRQLWRTPQPSSRSPARPGKSIEKVHRLYYVEQKINDSMRTIILSEMNGALQLTFSTFVHMRINAPFDVFRIFCSCFPLLLSFFAFSLWSVWCVYMCLYIHFIAHMAKRSASLSLALSSSDLASERNEWKSWIVSLNYFCLWSNFFFLCLHCCCHCYYLRMLWWYIKKYIHLCLHAYESIVRMWTCEHVCVCVDLDTLWVNEMFGIHFSPENIFLFHIFLFLSHSIIHERVIVVRMIFKLSFGLRF